MPVQLTPNVWLITTPLSASENTISMICPGSPTKFVKIIKPVHILKMPTACSATLSYFHLPPIYHVSHLDANISLDVANLQLINISSLDFHIWQHLEDHSNDMQLQHLSTLPSIPVNKIYQHLLNNTRHITPFDTEDDFPGDTDSIWTLFSHTGVYVTTIGSFIPAGLGIFCCYFFWC